MRFRLIPDGGLKLSRSPRLAGLSVTVGLAVNW